VEEDGVKLTSYFGGRPVGGALADLYGRREIAASVLLRDTAVAVDTSGRIDAVLGPARSINPQGLTTTERTRFLSQEIDAPAAGGAGSATKLTVYFGQADTVFGVPASEAMCELLRRRGIGPATAVAGVDGTVHGQRQHGHFFSRYANPPMMVVAIGTGSEIAAVLPEVGGLLRYPLMTLDGVQVCKRDGQLMKGPDGPWADPDGGPPAWPKLTVFAAPAARHDGQPLHRVMARRLRSAGLSPHQVPAMTVVIVPPPRLGTAFAIIDELTTEGATVTCENVTAIEPGREPGSGG
jgi:PII-like signaling protein